MTLPSSGIIDASGIYSEYYKTHTTEQVDISVMSVLFEIADASVPFANFYDKRCIKTDVSTWTDPNGSVFSDTINHSGNKLLEANDYIYWKPRFIGHTAVPDIDVSISYTSMAGNYDPNNGLTLRLVFDYNIGGGWVEIVGDERNTAGAITWNAGYGNLASLNAAESAALEFRFGHEFNGAPEGGETFDIGGTFESIIEFMNGGLDDVFNIISSRDGIQISEYNGTIDPLLNWLAKLV